MKAFRTAAFFLGLSLMAVMPGQQSFCANGGDIEQGADDQSLRI